MQYKAKRSLQFHTSLDPLWVDLGMMLGWVMDSEYSPPEFQQESARSRTSEHCRWHLAWLHGELAFDFLVDTWAENSQEKPLLKSTAQTTGLSTLASSIPWRLPKTRAVWFRREWTYQLGRPGTLLARMKLNIHAQGLPSMRVSPVLDSSFALSISWEGIHTAHAAVRLDTEIKASELPSKIDIQDAWSSDGKHRRSFLFF